MGIYSNILGAIDAAPRDMGAYRDMMAFLAHERAEGASDHRHLLDARRRVSSALGGGWAGVDQIDALIKMLRDLLTMDAVHDLDAFMQAMEFDRAAEERLWLPRRQQLMHLCREYQWFETDPEAEFLSVSMPPRTAKSSTACMAMTWHIGRNVTPSNLMTAHSDKLTKHFYQQLLAFMEDPTYRFAEIFPDAAVVWRSAEDEAFSVGKKRAYPTCTCRSVNGTLTGAVEVGEGGWLYSDDLIEDLEEALSPRRLDAKWEAYVNQCYDRRKKGSKQLMVGTRWDVRDPIGRMVDLHRGEPGFHVLAMPALDPVTGESNFDYSHGLGFDRKYYLDMRRTTDSATYAAKYDGDPIVREGQLFSPDALERYLSLPTGEPAEIVAAVDTKGTGTDYEAMPVLARWEGSTKWFLIDCICDNSAPDVVNPRVARMIVNRGVQRVRFESNAAGGIYADSVKKLVEEAGHLCSITKKYSMSNKETRIIAAQPWIIENILFPDADSYAAGSDMERYMNQIVGFVLDGKNPHDDAPDSLAMAADFVSRRRTATAKALSRPI